MDLAPFLIILFVLVCASGFFSGTEVAMFSLRRVDREHMARSESKLDSLVLRLLARPRRLIATILIGNEFVNVSVSVVVASLVGVLYAGGSELTAALLSTLIALPLLLFFGEITPKTIAIKTSVGWSRSAARPLWLWGMLVAPIRGIVRGIANLVIMPFAGKAVRSEDKEISEEELLTLVDAGASEGEVDIRERRIIHRVFQFGDKTVDEVMMPRDKIFALSYELSMPRLMKEVAARGYSRVPIYQKRLDNIRGILYARDLVAYATGRAGQPRALADILHEPLFVPRTIPIERLFRIFKQRKIHLALVVNEYGKLAGIVTMEDLLEELFGEIRDEREQQKETPRRVVRLRTDPGTAIVVGEGPGGTAPFPKSARLREELEDTVDEEGSSS